MNHIETMKRLYHIHQLIQQEETGALEKFAKRMHLSKRQLYYILKELKDSGADIKYNRNKCTYFYANNFEFVMKISTNPSSG
jgi:predicted DNA-binding transcriptional regulator YafY